MSIPISQSQPRRSTLAAFVDVRFERLIARDVIGVVYILLVTLSVIGGAVTAIALIVSGGWGVLAGLAFVPVATLLQIIVIRLIAEGAVVYFRIADDVQALRRDAATRLN